MSASLLLYAILAITCTVVDRALGGSCPDNPIDIYPCTCDNTTVRCVAIKKFDLQLVMETLARLTSPDVNSFDNFELEANAVEMLDDSTFQGVTFEYLKFNGNTALTCVHPKAFEGLSETVVSFESTLTSFSDYTPRVCDIFGALSSLHLINKIQIIGSGIQQIPDNAFNGILKQINLNSIDLSGNDQGGNIKSIGKHAFSKLPNLRNINLSSHKINTIWSNAFQFEDWSVNTLTINLNQNPLTNITFMGPLNTNGRITTMYLEDMSTLRQLSESVFDGFLEDRAWTSNKINLTGTPCTVTEGNKWIIVNKEREHLEDKLINFNCTDGGPIFKHKLHDFDNPDTFY
ncbi:vasorin-like [Oppia nitens]|uniref:vasorin-like n=1 Tax=Oppia nitens TaxID=1686743 RepID=UPI0023DBDF36|nr:vasorin-like [Oppia nitens]